MADRKVTVRFVESSEWNSIKKKDYEDAPEKTGEKSTG
jgi:OOP family OmpA-OmpF porin